VLKRRNMPGRELPHHTNFIPHHTRSPQGTSSTYIIPTHSLTHGAPNTESEETKPNGSTKLPNKGRINPYTFS
jgi:hypothetical protein